MKIDIKTFRRLRHSFVFKLISIVGLILILSFTIWAYFNIRHWKEKTMVYTVSDTAVVSLEEMDKEILLFAKGVVVLAFFIFLLTSIAIFIFVSKFVSTPIKKLIIGMNRMTDGNYSRKIDINQEDEMGRLATATNQMGRAIEEKQAELNRQRNEYQNLFEQVPCLITVQDKDYRLLRFNREFSEKFNPEPGDYCYHAYKGRTKKCEICPVEKTFKDGESHYGEEAGSNKDGTITHWVVKTSPIRDDLGNIIAAMEMSLDITRSRRLERELEKSEKKYQEIFNNMPNPAFVLDEITLDIIDCNQRVTDVYGYTRDNIIETSFLDLFKDKEKGPYAASIKTYTGLNRVAHLTKAGETIYVAIWIAPSAYAGQKVFLVTTSDITRRLETEAQLIQAGKMATLGEMATGVAHELNQPLSVIKTASSFCIKKTTRKEKLADDILFTMLKKIDSNVDRATRIITHMRQFARKTDLKLVKVEVNDVLRKASDMFSQQLRLKGIEVAWETEKDLPPIMADPDRMEQVVINLLMNARDAVEEKWDLRDYKKGSKKITLRTWSAEKNVFIEVCDTGPGIPETISDKIFEPFFTTKEVGKGTGLGLSISYGIVKDCLGTIQIRSTQKEGTCFILKFPIQGNE